MAGIDKAAIAFSIAITIVGVGIAFIGSSADYSLPVSTPTVVSTETSESNAGTDPFADLAQKVRDEAAIEKETVEEETMMEETVEEETMMEETVEEETMMEETVEEETMMEETVEEETMMEVATGPQTLVVEIPKETAFPGCEETDSCYAPANITINVGDTIEWINVDTAAHTSTSGSPSEGPSFVFDSSLIRADASFAFTFEEAGTFDYYCMVHPWMLGSVTVN